MVNVFESVVLESSLVSSSIEIQDSSPKFTTNEFPSRSLKSGYCIQNSSSLFSEIRIGMYIRVSSVVPAGI